MWDDRVRVEIEGGAGGLGGETAWGGGKSWEGIRVS